MEPTPIIILKRPNTVKHDDQTVEKATSQATSKTLEEKLAKYEEARRRILGSDSEEDQQDGGEKPTAEPEIEPVQEVVTPKPKASPSPPTKGSPEKVATQQPKSNGITPLMSIEFKQMENAMENLALKPADEGGRQKKSLFRVENAESIPPQMLMANSGEPFVPQSPPMGYHGHYAPPVMPSHFHVRQYVNNSILHPYANSSMNHVRAHNHYPQSYASHQQPRFNLAGGSFTAGQVNFVPNPPFSLNVPPPGYYPTPMQFPQSQMTAQQQSMHNNHHQTYPDAAARQGKHQRHLDMNFS